MNILQIMGSASGNEVVVKVGAQHGQRHVAKARKQQRLCIVERLVEGGIHCLFDKAARRLRPVTDGEERGLPSAVDIAQREFDRSQASVHPPPCPFSDRTYPWSRRPAKIRRITTGLVSIAFASTSDVTGPPCSAMCSRTWSTPDKRLSRLM